MHDAGRMLLGAVVVLALLFGVLRPALRAITGQKKNDEQALEPHTADVQLVDDDGTRCRRWAPTGSAWPGRTHWPCRWILMRNDCGWRVKP